MTSSGLPDHLLEKFASNQRMVVGTAIAFIHSSILVFLLFDNIQRWRFLSYTILPALATAITPFLVTSPIIRILYKSETAEAYYQTLSRSMDEGTRVATEIELTSEVQEQLPHEVADPDSLRITNTNLLDNVSGEKFDPVDADTRGVIAIGFACLPVIFTAPAIGIHRGGTIPVLCGFLVAVVAVGVILQQHRDMVGLIEYTPTSIDT